MSHLDEPNETLIAIEAVLYAPLSIGIGWFATGRLLVPTIITFLMYAFGIGVIWWKERPPKRVVNRLEFDRVVTKDDPDYAYFHCEDDDFDPYDDPGCRQFIVDLEIARNRKRGKSSRCRDEDMDLLLTEIEDLKAQSRDGML